MKLMLLIIPAIQRTRESDRERPAEPDDPGPNGFAMKSTTIAQRDREQRRAPSWPANCQRARRSSESSRTPNAVARAPPRSRPTSSSSWTVGGTARIGDGVQAEHRQRDADERDRDRDAAAARDRAAC